jgi:hypothetical protein
MPARLTASTLGHGAASISAHRSAIASSASDRLDISSTTTIIGAGDAGPAGIVFARRATPLLPPIISMVLDLGLVGQSRHGSWSFDWPAGIALGAIINDAQINGSTA